MSDAGAQVIIAWTNTIAGITIGDDAPLPVGAFAHDTRPRSPVSGAYALISRVAGGSVVSVAEDSPLKTVRVTADCYAGTEAAAELAAQAWLGAARRLRGSPVPVPGTGSVIRVTDNYSGPALIPPPATDGEAYCYRAGADFILMEA